MATPITINRDKKPAATNPAAQRQTRKAQCKRGASIKSSCWGEESLLFLDMLKAEKTADRIIKTAGQMADLNVAQSNWNGRNCSLFGPC
jgi:predicted metal-binding protein